MWLLSRIQIIYYDFAWFTISFAQCKFIKGSMLIYIYLIHMSIYSDIHVRRTQILLPGSSWYNGMGNWAEAPEGKQEQSTSLEGTSLVVLWLRLRASTAGSTGWIPGWGTKIPHAMRHSQKKKKLREHKPWSMDLIEGLSSSLTSLVVRFWTFLKSYVFSASQKGLIQPISQGSDNAH